MAGKISELTAATAWNDSDEFELLQSGGNLRVTKAVMRRLLAPTSPTVADGNFLMYNGNLSTPDFQAQSPKWRTLLLGTDYTAVAASSSTITVTSATVTLAPAGTPIRFNLGSGYLYAIVTASSGTTLTLSGPSCTGTLTELAIGNHSQLALCRIVVPTAYGVLTTQLAAGQLIWLGPPAAIVAYQMQASAVYAGTKPVLQMRVNASGTYVSSTGLTITAANTIYTPTVATYSTTGYAVTYGQVIEPYVPTTAGTSTTGTNLMIDLAIVKA